MADGWWLPSQREKLSTGDVLSAVPFFTAILPPSYVRPGQLSGGAHGWHNSAEPIPQKGTNRIHALAAVKSIPALVLSYDCEIDKPHRKTRVLLAPIAPIDGIPKAEDRDAVLHQRNLKYFPLPEIPGFGSCYADLRSMSSFPLEITEDVPVAASMTDAARERVASALVLFLLRRKLPSDLPTADDYRAAAAACAVVADQQKVLAASAQTPDERKAAADSDAAHRCRAAMFSEVADAYEPVEEE